MNIRKVVFAMFLLLVVFLASGCGPNRVEKAKELLKVKSNNEAIKLLDEEIKDNPKNGEAFLVYGQILYENDPPAARERLTSALLVDNETHMKDKVIKCVEKNISCAEDLSLLDKAEYGYVDGNADLCYKRYVEYSNEAAQFSNRFPNDPRAAGAVLEQANGYKRDGSDVAKTLYRFIIEKYPKSAQAKEAQAALDDWWKTYTMDLPADNKWHSLTVEVQKGQRYQYEISGDVVLRDGFGALVHFTGDNTLIFFGSRQELRDGMYQSRGSTTGFAKEAGCFRSGKALKRSQIWFTIATGAEFEGSLTVKLKLQEKA